MKTQNKQNSTKQFPLLSSCRQTRWRGLGRGFVTLTILLFTFNSYSQGSGHALGFDGNSDYVDIISNNTLQLDNMPFTIQIWVKTSVNTLGIYDELWISGYVGTTPYALEFLIHDNVIILHARDHLSNSMLITGSIIVNDDRWHFVTATRNLGVYKIYVDGILDVSATTGVIGDVDHPMANARIGYVSVIGIDRYFSGTLDEVRIWNRALTQTEIQENMCKKLTGTEPGLVAYYPMNEGIDNTCSGGEDVCDMSGNGNNGTKF